MTSLSVWLNCMADNFMRLPFLEVLDLAPPEEALPKERLGPTAQLVVLAGLFDIQAVFVPRDVDDVLTQAQMLARPHVEPTPGFSSYGPAPHRRWPMARTNRPRGLN